MSETQHREKLEKGHRFPVKRGDVAIAVFPEARQDGDVLARNLRVIAGRERIAYKPPWSEKWEAYLCVEEARSPDCYLDTEAQTVRWCAEDFSL